MPIPSRFILFLLGSAALCSAAETSFKESLDENNKKKKYGPYVGVYGGSTQGIGTDATATIDTPALGDDDLSYDLSPRDGDVLFGFEVGYSWKQKRMPFETSLEFEGFFTSTQLDGVIDKSHLSSLAPDGLTGFHTDMSSVSFMLNATITLDLSKYRARIGRWLPKFRPYFGAGVGGSQLWFRNTTYTTKDPTKLPGVAPFSIDEFVFSWQVFGGLEFQVNEKFSLYGEFRTVHYEKFDIVDDFSIDSFLAGVRLRY